MSENPDRRVQRTRTAIRRALLALMQEKGYEAVTVSDIIRRADVGRSTFYSHYTDKRDVLYASLDDLAAFLREHRDRSDDPLGFSLPMFEHVHQQRAMLRTLLGRRGGTMVQERVAHLLGELVREGLAGRPTAVPPDLLIAVVVGAYLRLLARWVDDHETYTAKEMDAAFRRVIGPGVLAATGRGA